MDAAIAHALSLADTTSIRDRTVDITTIGTRSQEPRRIEIWFHNVDGEVYITGSPGPRSWYLNLVQNPAFTFHLKNDVKADLAATATAITESDERTRVLPRIVDSVDALYAGSDNPPAFPPVEEWLDRSPLVRVTFDESA